MSIFQIIGLVLAILGLAVVVYIIYYLIRNPPFFTVQEQQAVVIERLGRYTGRVCSPGIHLIIPGYHKKRKITEGGQVYDYVDLRERAVDLPAQSVITKDNVQLEVDSMAYYEITDPAKAVYGVTDVVVAVNQLIKTVLRDVIGDTNLQELLSGRENINLKLRDQVSRASGDWGITIRSVELQSVNPPQSYIDAMRRVSEAELAKKAAITEAQGKKEASILEAEGEADKISKIYSAIHAGNPNDELLKIKYLEALEKIADGKATKVFMPFPANPSSDNFFQQAFGMAAGLDAYKDTAEQSSQSQKTTPIEKGGETPPRRRLVRRVVKKPSSPSDSNK
jgi:regulator of protease activity HflC (stomatin/prohibitin superfamily)